MGDNSNHNPTNPGFKKDDAYQSLTLINTWIGNIDTKISFALALAGVLIGVIFSGGFPSAFQRIAEVTNLAELHGSEILAVILVGALYCVSFLSIISFIWAIIARVKNSNKSPSLFFFGSIGKMELQSYKDSANRVTEPELIEDLEEQIHTNSKICNQKVKYYNIGMYLLLGTVVLWFVCMVFRMI